MAAVLTTSAQIVVKIVAIRKRRPRKAPSRAALFAKRQSRAALEAEAGILQGGDGRLEVTVTSAFAPPPCQALAARAETAFLVSTERLSSRYAGTYASTSPIAFFGRAFLIPPRGSFSRIQDAPRAIIPDTLLSYRSHNSYSPGVIHFYERVFDIGLHFYEQNHTALPHFISLPTLFKHLL